MIYLFSMVSFFASTCPIRSGVGAIDNPDQSGQVFEQYDVSEVPEKIFSDDFSMACRQKMFIFGHFKACISNYTDYNLYQRKLDVLTDDLSLHESPNKNLETVSKNKGHTSSS